MQKYLINKNLLLKIVIAIAIAMAIFSYGFFSVHTQFDEQKKLEKVKTHKR